MTEDEQKQAAAEKAVEYIEDGMVVGLGTGSCAAKMVDLLGKKVAHGLYVTGVPTSEATAAQARALGIPVVGLDEVGVIDLTIDGTDEVDPEGRLIKGGGGAHLREKIVASLSDKMIVIAEAKKKVARLGAFKLPVEVIRFAAPALKPKLEALGSTPILRQGKDGNPFVTDEGNYIYDCDFGVIDDPEGLALELSTMPGVVEHGLFIGYADLVLIGTDSGVEVIEV
ncbi:ribose-5-phosphate isomerase RpiA [Sneathiella chungangensis]|uniref:Ribose-5-phosphate isomerase A n=1 Tax=Sneathiella chungangensis TaxID=1418234 RepID=A0A845MJT3_9PROT|nr:ribose-5-phosphate isomerase RpiA [Sneathiella chungangensis]MZR23945.1 ribose-5-phosphate isomerase RpiA [Sneathiella chungangensis]